MGIKDSGEAGQREDRTHRILSLSLLAERVGALLFTYWCLCRSFASPMKMNFRMVHTLRKVGLEDLCLMCSVTGIVRIPGAEQNAVHPLRDGRNKTFLFPIITHPREPIRVRSTSMGRVEK